MGLYFQILRITLLSTVVLSLLDSVYLIISLISSSDYSASALALVIIRFVCCIGLVIYAWISGHVTGNNVDLCRVLLNLGYCLLTFAIMFSLGWFLSYLHYVWSLVLQITHFYVSMLYTFKLVISRYDDELAMIEAQQQLKDKLVEVKSGTEIGSLYGSYENVQRLKYGRIFYFINKNLMAFTTLLMIVIAILVAAMLRHTTDVNKWTPRKLMYLKFLGEIFLRMLLSLIVPLIGSSIATACAGFDVKTSGRIMAMITIYYLSSTVMASIEGIAIVSLIAPGHRSQVFEESPSNGTSSNATQTSTIEDTLLDMARNLFTDNIFQSWISTYKTTLLPPKANSSVNASNIYEWEIKGEQVDGSNVMSVVMFSLLIGIAATSIQNSGGQILLDLIEALNTIVMMSTLAIVEIAPLGSVFLIIPQVLSVPELAAMLKSVAWFTLTVLVSLTFHCLVSLSAVYFLFTRHNPYTFLSNMMPAVSTAFGTSSSSATMSVTMKCLEEKCLINKSIVRFCIPYGATVNMDGGALYEGVAAIFVAQYRNVPLNLPKLITISLTSVLVSIGAAGIPQAGMITTLIVLNSIGLSLEDAALVMVVDFFLDRFRTVVNVLGDAFGTAIVQERMLDTLPKPTCPPTPTPSPFTSPTINKQATPNTVVSYTTQNSLPTSHSSSSTNNSVQEKSQSVKIEPQVSLSNLPKAPP